MLWELRLPLICSISAALITIVLKFFAYWVTGSVGLFSDAIESLVNLLASITAFLSLWYASKPADDSHAYGHEKIEYFSSGMEGSLILVAAASIAWSAIERLFRPQPLEDLALGILVSIVAAGINLAVAIMLLRAGRKHDSIILEADGHHLLTDVWTSVAVVVALGLVRMTGWEILDPLIAIGVAINVAWTAFGLMRRSFDGLMDHALPNAERDLVRSVIQAALQPGMHFHALRTRQAGARRFVDFHLLVPGNWSVRHGHDFSDEIEVAIRKAVPNAHCTIHIEPVEAETAWTDSELLSLEPKRPQ